VVDARSGSKAALAEAIARADDPVEGDGVGDVVADLFEDVAEMGSGVGRQAAASGVGASAGPVKRSGPGRPKGAKNRRSEDWVAFLEAHFSHPLVGIATVQQMSWHEIAQMMLPRDGDGNLLTKQNGEPYRVTQDVMNQAVAIWMSCAKEHAEYMLPKQVRAKLEAESLPPMIQMNLNASPVAGSWGVEGMTLGVSENTMKSMQLEGEGYEVPSDEVPIEAEPAADTTASPESGD